MKEETPNISAAALAFLDCDRSIVLEDHWAQWACLRTGGLAFITDSRYSTWEFIQAAVNDANYNPQASLLFKTPRGFVLVPGFDGFEHVHTTLGQLPDLELIDTDLYPPVSTTVPDVCDTDPCHGPDH